MVTPAELDGVTRAAVGGGRRLAGVTRLRGGSKKGVYRLVLDDGGSVIAYIWADAENYWPAAGHAAAGDADPFSPGSGIELFDAARRRLEFLGVRTPRVLLTDRSGARYPADIAIVEDVPGEDLETRLERDPRGAETTLARLAQALDAMHGDAGPRFGKLGPVERGAAAAAGGSCEQVVLDRALADLAHAARREARIGRSRERLAAALRESRAAVQQRAEYRLIHGELGPDHVLVDRDGQPVLIDIEGLMYFDIEWEHVFLRLRFGEQYRWLTRTGLDRQRLHLYALAIHLSLVAGPLRQLDGDFPDRDGMLRIVEYNLQALLGKTAG